MTQELKDLISKKRIFVYTMKSGRTMIGEVIPLGEDDVLDPDRKQIGLLNVLEVTFDVDDDGQSDFVFVPLAPGNTNQVTAMFIDQIVTVSHASDTLKRHYYKVVTLEQVVTGVMSGEVDKQTLRLLKEKNKKNPSTPSRTIAEGDDYSITRVDSFEDDFDPTLPPPNPAALREPLDLESTAPFEVGLETFEGDEEIWKTIMGNFPHRPWKLNQ